MECLGRWWRLQVTAVESRVHDFAVGWDFGAFAVKDTHGLGGIESVVGDERLTKLVSQIQMCKILTGCCRCRSDISKSWGRLGRSSAFPVSIARE